jgi:hypothetical protein
MSGDIAGWIRTSLFRDNAYTRLTDFYFPFNSIQDEKTFCNRDYSDFLPLKSLFLREIKSAVHDKD